MRCLIATLMLTVAAIAHADDALACLDKATQPEQVKQCAQPLLDKRQAEVDALYKEKFDKYKSDTHTQTQVRLQKDTYDGQTLGECAFERAQGAKTVAGKQAAEGEKAYYACRLRSLDRLQAALNKY